MKVTVEAEVHKGVITKIRPVGCENCEPLKSKGKASGAFKKMAREEGMRFLRESAVEQVMAGVTTLREVNKVTFVE